MGGCQAKGTWVAARLEEEARLGEEGCLEEGARLGEEVRLEVGDCWEEARSEAGDCWEEDHLEEEAPKKDLAGRLMGKRGRPKLRPRPRGS